MYCENGIQYTLFDPPPRVFIIGTSAEGIVKSVKFLVKDLSLIDTVEINPAIVRIMQNELFELSCRAYENVDVKITDA
jgi:spermidine synthase